MKWTMMIRLLFDKIGNADYRKSLIKQCKILNGNCIYMCFRGLLPLVIHVKISLSLK